MEQKDNKKLLIHLYLQSKQKIERYAFEVVLEKTIEELKNEFPDFTKIHVFDLETNDCIKIIKK